MLHKLEDKGISKFIDLINEAHKQGIIKNHHKDKLNVIRDFRNYVHIHKEVDKSFELTEGITQLSRECCTSIIEQFRQSI